MIDGRAGQYHDIAEIEGGKSRERFLFFPTPRTDEKGARERDVASLIIFPRGKQISIIVRSLNILSPPPVFRHRRVGEGETTKKTRERSGREKDNGSMRAAKSKCTNARRTPLRLRINTPRQISRESESYTPIDAFSPIPFTVPSNATTVRSEIYLYVWKSVRARPYRALK